MSIRGSLDSVTGTGATGWAYASEHQDGITVQAVLNHEIVGETVATEHRPDLADAGMGNGNCGFTMKFYREIEPAYLPFVVVKADNGDAELPRASEAGFADFFAALYRAYPTAGRARSVFGGLWTDRTDAAALLKGKVDIGQVTQEVAGIIAQLIYRGMAIINGSGAQDATPARGKLTPERVAAVLEDPLTLSVLRAVCEDHPLVLTARAIAAGNTELTQPSAESRLPSPGECLVVLVQLGDHELELDMVRDSHMLPEFTAAGVSRWASADPHTGVELAMAQRGLMSRYVLTGGTTVIIGPGTVYKVRCGDDADGIKITCVPSRSMPLSRVREGNQREFVSSNGVRILV